MTQPVSPMMKRFLLLRCLTEGVVVAARQAPGRIGNRLDFSSVDLDFRDLSALKRRLVVAGEVGNEQRDLPLGGRFLQPLDPQHEVSDTRRDTIDAAEGEGVELKLSLPALLRQALCY